MWYRFFVGLCLAICASLHLGAVSDAGGNPAPVVPQVEVSFDAVDPVCLEADWHCTDIVVQRTFTAAMAVPARISCVVLPPPDAPPQLLWRVVFSNGQQVMHIARPGIFRDVLTLSVTGVSPMTRAGEYGGGLVTINIDPL